MARKETTKRYLGSKQLVTMAYVLGLVGYKVPGGRSHLNQSVFQLSPIPLCSLGQYANRFCVYLSLVEFSVVLNYSGP